MSLNVIDLIKGQLGPALISQAASQLGESESGISKAIGGLLPAVVGGLANNADKPGVLDAIKGAASSGLLSNLLGGSSNNSLITTVLSLIFGDKMSGVVNAISSHAGVSNTSSSSLLNMVAGAALGTLGKYSTDNNLGASGLTSLLGDQKGIVSSLLPAGLSLASLGFGNWGGHATPTVEAEKVKVTSYDTPKVEVNRGGTNTVNVDTDDNGGGSSLWKWLLPLLLLLAASWFIWKQCDKKKMEAATSNTDSTIVSSDTAMAKPMDTAAAMTTTTEMSEIDLNGKKLKGFTGGMESKMIDYLKSGAYASADDASLKSVWYSFDNVNFVFGKSDQITPESQGQLENLTAILKAFPDTKIKIGGYTDKKGDDKANKILSQKRADYLKAELTKLGVGAQVTGAEGYGEEFATVAESATDKERETDRKMSVRFAK